MFLLFGVAAGALTGVPIGPVNVAVIDAAYRHTFRRALAVGLGGACADMLYSGLGACGVTPFLRDYPSVDAVLYALSGVVLLVYGFLTARSQPVTPAHLDGPAKPPPDHRAEIRIGFRVGLALILLNPAAIVTWVVVVARMIPPATRFEGIFFAIGVFGGSWSWFSLVAYLTQRGKSVLGDKAAWIPRLIGAALMVYAVYLLARAVIFVV